MIAAAFWAPRPWPSLIKGGIGHNLPQEAPQAFADAASRSASPATASPAAPVGRPASGTAPRRR